jgi:hypothetical protein
MSDDNEGTNLSQAINACIQNPRIGNEEENIEEYWKSYLAESKSEEL